MHSVFSSPHFLLNGEGSPQHQQTAWTTCEEIVNDTAVSEQPLALGQQKKTSCYL